MYIINYEREMQKIIDGMSKEFKPKLLLHACCAPCASSCVERIKDFFDITLYFYNPNMDSENEYSLRAKELQRLAKYFGVECIIEEYNKQEYSSAVVGYEGEKEGGARCEKCFELRLKMSASKAKQLDMDFFATTLSVSPLKNSTLLNIIGLEIEKKVGIRYLPTDFKKKNGYIRSIELSKELNLYRQNYCGCEFSKVERELKESVL